MIFPYPCPNNTHLCCPHLQHWRPPTSGRQVITLTESHLGQGAAESMPHPPKPNPLHHGFTKGCLSTAAPAPTSACHHCGSLCFSSSINSLLQARCPVLVTRGCLLQPASVSAGARPLSHLAYYRELNIPSSALPQHLDQ